MRFLAIMSLTVALAVLRMIDSAQAQSTPASQPPTPTPNEITELQKKAAAGDSSAQYELGRDYEMGYGVPKNPNQAALWYRNAAEQGNAKAQSSLGVLYWIGDGVEKDKKEAVEWYRKAARQGNAAAMFNLGVAYYNGEGTNVNDTLAQAWFLLSSEGGDPSGHDAAARSWSEHGEGGYHDACFAIGEMYEKGMDLPPNPEQAIAWYKKAADGPHHGGAAMRLAGIYLKEGQYSEARPWCEVAAKDRCPAVLSALVI